MEETVIDEENRIKELREKVKKVDTALMELKVFVGIGENPDDEYDPIKNID